MQNKVVFIHTIPLLVNTFNQLGAIHLPDVKFFHIVNEVLIERVRLSGLATSKEKNWLRSQVESAVDIGASAVLVTCTILSACVDEVRHEYSIPIMKIDEEMVKKAVELGSKIGIIVTNPDTIKPSSQLIMDYANKVGKQVTIKAALVDKAFDAVRNGEAHLHDQLVRNTIFDIAPDVDVIVLAQASMARVLDIIPESERPKTILSSPLLAFEKLNKIISETT